MSQYLCKFVPHLKHSITIHSKFHRLCFVQLSSLQVEPKIPASENANHDCFTAKYLMEKCGFSRFKAVSALKYVNFDKPDKPDECLSFLKNCGFSETQLLKLVRKCPKIVACDPEKTLLPKVEFLHSNGFLEKEIIALVVFDPYIFVRSLEGHLVPTFDMLEDCLGSVGATRKTINCCPIILRRFQTHVLPKIQILKEAGVPNRCIAYGLRNDPKCFTYLSDKFQEAVEDIKKMGFEADSNKFVRGVCVIGKISKLVWTNKVEVFKRWDCSEEEVITTFKYEPSCMRSSAERIDEVINYFVNEMGWRPQMLLLRPQLLAANLQMRIVPRCSVYKVLLSKGLLKVRASMYTLLSYTEDKFLEKYVNRYPEEAPELLRLYKAKMKVSNEQDYDRMDFSALQVAEKQKIKWKDLRHQSSTLIF